MDTQCVADNIKVYRKERGLSQVRLASAAGISLPTVKKIETGEGPMTSRSLLAIAKVLGVSCGDLLLPLQIPDQVYFRCQKKMKEPKVLLHQISKWLQHYEAVEEIQQSHIPWSLKDVPYDGNPEHLAQSVRENLGILPREPILDICGLLDKAGVKQYCFEILSDGFFGLSLLDHSRKPAIVVNTCREITTERKRFTAAHELGHILMHFDSFKPFDIKDRTSKAEDLEADTFASFFLMPSEVFIEKWQETKGHDFYDRVMCVKQYFQVSYLVILKRLSQLSDRYNMQKMRITICNTYKQRKGCSLSLKSEPSPMRPYVFIEKRFRRLVIEALIQENITVSRAAEFLEIPIEEVQDIACEQVAEV